MTVQHFTFGPFQENTYIVHDETKEAVIIDPGCSNADEYAHIERYITKHQLVVKYLWNTHCHVDHIQGNYFIKKKYQVPFLIHPDEEPLLRMVKPYAPRYGFPLYQEVLPDKHFVENETLQVGKMEWTVLHLPGHSPGHVGFYEVNRGVLLSGDVLFENSIGRTDLPGGDLNTLLSSIQNHIFSLPDHVVVYSGHGNSTSVGHEKRNNPFCKL